MQHGAAGVFALQVVLHFQCFERIVGIADRQLRRIGVVRRLRRARLQDFRKPLAIFAREPVGRPFGGCGFQVIQMPGFLLDADDASAQMIEQPQAKGRARLGGNILMIGSEVADTFVNAVDADRAKVIPQSAQIPARKRIQPRFHPLIDHAAFQFQTLLGQFKQPVQFGEQPGGVTPASVTQPRAIQGDHTHRTCLLRRTEEAVATLE